MLNRIKITSKYKIYAKHTFFLIRKKISYTIFYSRFSCLEKLFGGGGGGIASLKVCVCVLNWDTKSLLYPCIGVPIPHLYFLLVDLFPTWTHRTKKKQQNKNKCNINVRPTSTNLFLQSYIVSIESHLTYQMIPSIIKRKGKKKKDSPKIYISLTDYLHVWGTKNQTKMKSNKKSNQTKTKQTTQQQR